MNKLMLELQGVLVLVFPGYFELLSFCRFLGLFWYSVELYQGNQIISWGELEKTLHKGYLGWAPGASMSSERNLLLIPLHLVFINRLLSWFLILCFSPCVIGSLYRMLPQLTGAQTTCMVYGGPVSFNMPEYDQGFVYGFSRIIELIGYV